MIRCTPYIFLAYKSVSPERPPLKRPAYFGKIGFWKNLSEGITQQMKIPPSGGLSGETDW